MNEIVRKFHLLDLICFLDKISRFISAEEKKPYLRFCNFGFALSQEYLTNKVFEMKKKTYKNPRLHFLHPQRLRLVGSPLIPSSLHPFISIFSNKGRPRYHAIRSMLPGNPHLPRANPLQPSRPRRESSHHAIRRQYAINLLCYSDLLLCPVCLRK